MAIAEIRYCWQLAIMFFLTPLIVKPRFPSKFTNLRCEAAMEERRGGSMDDRRVPEVLAMDDYFVEALLPKSHETINVDAIISRLRQRGTIAANPQLRRQNSGNGSRVEHWVSFDKEYSSAKSPKTGTKHGDDVFKALKLIHDVIALWLQMPPNQTAAMKHVSPKFDWEKVDDSEDSDYVSDFPRIRHTLLTFRSA